MDRSLRNRAQLPRSQRLDPTEQLRDRGTGARYQKQTESFSVRCMAHLREQEATLVAGRAQLDQERAAFDLLRAEVTPMLRTAAEQQEEIRRLSEALQEARGSEAGDAHNRQK